MFEQKDPLALYAGVEPGVVGRGADFFCEACKALAEDVAVQVVGAGRVLAEGLVAGLPPSAAGFAWAEFEPELANRSADRARRVRRQRLVAEKGSAEVEESSLEAGVRHGP